ncbi:MAG: 30S ribosomal protein S18 [Omnitrophica WOR_2 bacterium RBG_13_44_8]|nr:MAG: 30S ribosomal protein S18 [Omnitrophica WOR_2 bacterium RBG_13_44_8]
MKKQAKQFVTPRTIHRYCYFCKEKMNYIDYKDTSLLKRFISDKGKIRPRRLTGTCAQHQSELATSIKRSRQVALIDYTSKL